MILGYETISVIGNDMNYRDKVIVDDGSMRKIHKEGFTWIQNPMICPSCHNSNCLTKYNYYKWYCVLCGWEEY
jgi:hypothetical protein